MNFRILDDKNIILARFWSFCSSIFFSTRFLFEPPVTQDGRPFSHVVGRSPSIAMNRQMLIYPGSVLGMYSIRKPKSRIALAIIVVPVGYLGMIQRADSGLIRPF